MEWLRRRIHPPECLERRVALAASGSVVPSDPGFTAEWGLRNTGQFGGTPGVDIGATIAWQATTGSRQVVVAVVDSGVDLAHPDLAPNLWTNPGEIAGNCLDDDGNGFVDDVHGWDFVDGDGLPQDGYGHGTHVAGIIGAAGNDGRGVTGVAWQVSIMVLRVLDDRGAGSAGAAAAALDYAARMRRDHGINVVVANVSWVLPGAMSTGLDAALAATEAAGITVVAAAGNFGSDNDLTPRFPASTTRSNVIAVAALDPTGALAPMSNWGATTVDIAAPGTLILSTWPGGGEARLSGTSMAAPFVTGAVALVSAVRPDLGAAEVRAAVLASAVPLAGLAGRLVTGGRLDLPGALAAVGVQVTRPPAETRASDVMVTVRPATTRGFVIDVTVRFTTAVVAIGRLRVPLAVDGRATRALLVAAPMPDTLVFRLVAARPLPRHVTLGRAITLPRGSTLQTSGAAPVPLGFASAVVRIERAVGPSNGDSTAV